MYYVIDVYVKPCIIDAQVKPCIIDAAICDTIRPDIP